MLAAQRKDLILATLRVRGPGRRQGPRRRSSSCPRTRSAATCASSPPTACCTASTAARCPASPAVADFTARTGIGQEAKVEVGRLAAGLVRPGQTVAVDGGTTALQLARHLPRDLAATVVTHSPTIAVELANHPTVEVIIVGGRLFKHSVVAVGRGRPRGDRPDQRRRLLPRRHRHPPHRRADHRRRRRGGDEAGLVGALGRHLRARQRREDRRRVRVRGASRWPP